MNQYDPKYVEPRPWILGGCNGRGFTTPTGYIGDGLIADFDTKAHAEHALMCVNAHDGLLDALREAKEIIRVFHDIGVPKHARAELWDLYQQSPEMKRLNIALGDSPASDFEKHENENS